MSEKEYEFVTEIEEIALLCESYGFNIHKKLTIEDIVKLLNGEKLVIYDGYEYCKILEVY